MRAWRPPNNDDMHRVPLPGDSARTGTYDAAIGRGARVMFILNHRELS